MLKLQYYLKTFKGVKKMNLKEKGTELIGQVKTYWKTPPKDRYMTFKEIAAYSGGGIGAYMIITLGTACLLGTNNVLLSSTLGIAPMDMYVMYVIAVVLNVFLSGIRANIIDNTRNKAGKYRPYIVSMAIPTAIITITMVWFPYNKLGEILGDGMIFGETKAYVAKCAIIMFLNILLHFFYYFFYDSYENLIHVLSPDSQERADVASIKSVVYSLAPSIINLVMPLIAQNVFHTNLTDIRVYRLVYPILAVGGILLCIIVYKYTEEKIVQARTHVVQIKFIDAFKAVAKNKYFWIISLAGWIGFLEIAYSNIMAWLYNYGGACSGNTYGLIVTLYGNASLWGMLAAPFCIRKWGKKAVLVVTNLFNIVCILVMYLFVEEINTTTTMWLVFSSMWINALMGSFAHILNPSIQADIRDYQQYKTGERIDGMFGVVSTMGTVLALITSSVLPSIYEKSGITEENAWLVTQNPSVLARELCDNLTDEFGEVVYDKFGEPVKMTVGDMLYQQSMSGQEVYTNAYSALYDLDVLSNILQVLIIVAAFGALLNVIPYFWYDFNERKQKSIVRVLKIRAMFEDYGNGIENDGQLVEGVEIIRKAREMVNATSKADKKSDYRKIKDKKERKEAIEFDEEIEVAKFVCEELDKFSTDEYKYKYSVQNEVYKAGLQALKNINIDTVNSEIAKAKALPKSTEEEKKIRKGALEIAKNKKSSYKTIKKYFNNDNDFVQPSFEKLEALFDKEDALDLKLKELYLKKKKVENKAEIKTEIKKLEKEKAVIRKETKTEMDIHAYFNRAAKVYLDAEKLVNQKENYEQFEKIEAMYDEAKVRYDAYLEEKRIEEEKKIAEEKAEKAKS